MNKAYRVWDGNTYQYKFDVEDGGNPKDWALTQQSKGFQVEVGTPDWDDKDRFGWTWEKKTIGKIKRKGGMRRMTYKLAKKFLDLKAECDTLKDVADKMKLDHKQIMIMNAKLNLDCYKDYVSMWEMGVTDYEPNYINTITEDIFNQIWDKHEEGMNQTLIGEILNINRRTVCSVVNLSCNKYKEFKERRDENI